MSDILEVFGVEYTGVNGFKAKDNTGTTLIYTRDSGTLPSYNGSSHIIYDGTYPIYDGLVAWFDVTNASSWNNCVSTSQIGNSITAKATDQSFSGVIWLASTNPTIYNNGFADTVKGLFVPHTISSLVGTTTAFTLEMINYFANNQSMIHLKTNTEVGVNNTSNPSIWHHINNINGYLSGIKHLVMVFTDGAISWFINGSFVLQESTEVSFNDILASYPLFTATNASGRVGDVRIYNRALTIDEASNNYLYTLHETDYTTPPSFTS